MLELSTLGTFILVVIGLFLVPGPAVLLTVSRTIQGGRKTGILTGLGIATGDFIHTLFAALGLSAILMTSATAFNLVKYAGAIYLIYMGIKAIVERTNKQNIASVSKAPSLQSYSQAILAEVLNPKTAIFFLAFLPQFIHPEKGPAIVQFLLLGFIFVVMSCLYTSMIVISIRPIGRLMKRTTNLGKWSGKFAGLIYIWLGVKVAFQQR
ncbi:LysE family translocator [Siminovitchia acidinfaciens]|uniref:LysE family translocator n=1 Tax=Siminovitchia acidinfaciens TaxID=2321395 RepID=A0A429XX62_9BACI|nr:LysE family translocator [Siminovitchia acidinfaciens]RST73083.1 LysE family translocator [Siminovitchia acidinfaciens]